MDIRTLILARPGLAEMRAARDLDGLAAALNETPELALHECWVDGLGIINRCPSGKSILRKLKAGAAMDAIIEVAWTSLLSGKGLDFGAESTLANIDEMAPAIGFTESEVAELKVLALQPFMVTRDQVRKAMFNDDSTEKE
jgi:hypothetical protein